MVLGIPVLGIYIVVVEIWLIRRQCGVPRGWGRVEPGGERELRKGAWGAFKVKPTL